MLSEAESRKREVFFDEFNEGARKVKLDPQIRYDIYRMIAGEDDNFRDDAVKWIKANFSKGVARFWKDNIARFLQKKSREL